MTSNKEPTVYTLYLDSCGDAGWCSPYGKSTVKYYVNAGVALTASADLKAQTAVKDILVKYLGASVRTNPHIELVYHDLIRGKNAYSSLTPEERLTMANDVFELFTKLQPIVFATVVDKIKLKEMHGFNALTPKQYGIMATISRFSLFLKLQTNGIGIIMMDQEEVKNDRLLQEMILGLKTYGTANIECSNHPTVIDKLDRILNTISFSDSSIIPGIQLADVCCRTVWQKYENQKGERYRQLLQYFNQDEHRHLEPSEIPK